MTQAGYQQGSEGAWWWKVAQRLDEVQLASVNAIAHNVDDPTILLAFLETIRQAQALLLEIFRAKDLLPAVSPSPPPGTPADVAPPEHVSAPPPPSGMAIPWIGPSFTPVVAPQGSPQEQISQEPPVSQELPVDLDPQVPVEVVGDPAPEVLPVDLDPQIAVAPEADA